MSQIPLRHFFFVIKGQNNTGHLIEVQLRSKIQQSWATAVEVVDTFTSQSIKTERCQKKLESFF
jgi:hypothetical protein